MVSGVEKPAVYQSALTSQLRNLGYEIDAGKSGAPEIKGYSQECLDASSLRSKQIQEQLAKTGYSGPEAAQIAAHATRDSKHPFAKDGTCETSASILLRLYFAFNARLSWCSIRMPTSPNQPLADLLWGLPHRGHAARAREAGQCAGGPYRHRDP